MVIPQPPSQHASGLRVGGPFLHALSVAQRGQPFRQVNKALTLAPVTLTKGVAPRLIQPTVLPKLVAVFLNIVLTI